jgi:hypothetical protein
MAREVLFQRYGEHRDYEGESFDFQDELEPSFHQSSVDEPISQVITVLLFRFISTLWI